MESEGSGMEECCENEKWSMWKCNDGKCMVQSTKVCE